MSEGFLRLVRGPGPPSGLFFALLLAAALVALGFFVLWPAASGPEAQSLSRYAKGDMAKLEVLPEPPRQPGQAFENTGGETVRLADFRGAFVVLNVWATWCAPCQTEMPSLAALERRFRDEGLEVVAVSIDGASQREKAAAMLASLSGGDLDFYIDPTRKIAFEAEAPGFPTTIFYDRHGRELWRVAGGADWSSPEAQALVRASLSRD
jgi:thiol-disulfide isomerase/thioredoxin